MRPRFTPEEALIMCREYESGIGCTALATKYGCAAATITSTLRRYGVQIRSMSESQKISPARHEQTISQFILSQDEAEALVDGYQKGFTCEELGVLYNCSSTTVRRALQRCGLKLRNLSEAQKISSRKQIADQEKRALDRTTELQICGEYKSGLSSTELAEKYKVGTNTILRTLDRHGVSKRKQGGYNDILSALVAVGAFAGERKTKVYICALKDFPGLNKVGITFDVSKRIRESKYVELLATREFNNRRDALFVEQAILQQTHKYAETPVALVNWPGATEIRRIDDKELQRLLDFYSEQLALLGTWRFVDKHLRLAKKERALLKQYLDDSV